MYDGFYKLSKKPFQLNPDPEFFFQSSIHKRAMAYMLYGLKNGEGFVLVTGSPGMGKTMLVKSLINYLNNTYKSQILIGLIVTSHIGPEDTLRVAASAFGYDKQMQDRAGLLIGFEKFILEKSYEGKRLFLIVDEAQNLPKQSLEELRILANKDVNGRPVFQVCLVGQNELMRTVNAPDMEQLKQRIVAPFQLKAMDAEETRNYIIFRLQQAGWQDKPAFDMDAFKAIYGFTEGVPRRINTLCDRLLVYGYLEELELIDMDAVNKVVDEIKGEMLYGNSATANETEAARVINSDIPTSIEEKLANLEKSVSRLRIDMDRERALLRKAILIQLDMGDVYCNSSNLDS